MELSRWGTTQRFKNASHAYPSPFQSLVKICTSTTHLLGASLPDFRPRSLIIFILQFRQMVEFVFLREGGTFRLYNSQAKTWLSIIYLSGSLNPILDDYHFSFLTPRSVMVRSSGQQTSTFALKPKNRSFFDTPVWRKISKRIHGDHLWP